MGRLMSWIKDHLYGCESPKDLKDLVDDRVRRESHKLANTTHEFNEQMRREAHRRDPLGEFVPR